MVTDNDITILLYRYATVVDIGAKTDYDARSLVSGQYIEIIY